MKTVVVRGRVIRFEKGKEAEIFTLVLKGTQEESWFNTSTAGKEFIEINEIELHSILTGKELVKEKETAKESDLLFRL